MAGLPDDVLQNVFAFPGTISSRCDGCRVAAVEKMLFGTNRRACCLEFQFKSFFKSMSGWDVHAELEEVLETPGFIFSECLAVSSVLLLQLVYRRLAMPR